MRILLILLVTIPICSAEDFLPYAPIVSIRDGLSTKFVEYESTVFHKTKDYYYAVTTEEVDFSGGRKGIKLSHPDNIVFQAIIQVEHVASIPTAPIFFYRFPNLDWFDIQIDQIKEGIEYQQSLKVKRWSYSGLDHISSLSVYSETYSEDGWKYTVIRGAISKSWYGCPVYHKDKLYGVICNNFYRNKKNYGTIIPMTKVFKYFNER